MRISDAGIDLIKRFEGCRLVAYLDAVGVWTIGYGSTVDVAPGMQITMAQAEDRLRRDLEDAERAVNDLVTAPITQAQFDSLVSWTYNLGRGNLQKSTLLRHLNAGKYADAGYEFSKWDKAGGHVLAGLTARRRAEQRMFESSLPDSETA